MLGLIACEPTYDISSVWPSGGAFATRSMPMLPPAPARLSTTTAWPHFSDSFWPTIRASASDAPPGACGTTRRTGLVGKV
jgi:hypothetical protein